MRISTARWWLAIALLASALPFLNQPFHIDDRIYLEVAENTLRNPLFPYDYPPIFEGLYTPDAASHSHLPLVSYWLAAIRILAGVEREWIFHLAFLPFALLAIWAFYDLASRWLLYPLAAALLLLFSTGFFVLSHTLMTEVPLLAFWLLAISRFVRILDGSARRADWWLCAAGLFGAGFISLLSAGLTLLLGTVLVLRRFETGGKASLPATRCALLLLLPVFIWIVWYGAGYLHFERFLLIRTALHMDKRETFSAALIGAKALSFILNLGGAFLFPLTVWYGLGRKRTSALLLVALAAGAIGVGMFGEDWTVAQSALFGLLLGTGLLAMAGLAREWIAVWQERERQNLPVEGWEISVPALWFTGIFAACVLLYPSGSVRYSLLAGPPLILLWQSSLERLVSKNLYLLRNLLVLSVCLTAIWSTAISHADYALASVYKKAAREIIADYRRPDRTIWFTAEWGFRWYLEREGALLLARTDPGPKPGDIIVKPRLAFPWVTLYDSEEYVLLLEQRPVAISTPIRILDFSSHAGFYSTAWGILPYSVTGGEPWEWFNVFEVKKKYDGPIPEPEKHY